MQRGNSGNRVRSARSKGRGDRMQDRLGQLYLTMGYMNHRRCTPEWCIERACTPFIDISYVIGGKATYIINGQPHRVVAGDLICVPLGSDRQANCDADDLMECYCMNFQLYDHQTRQEATLPFDLITHIGIHPSIIRLFDELYTAWLLREDGGSLLATGYALIIISKLLSITRLEHPLDNTDQRVHKAVRHIIEHSSEPLTVGMLADMVNLHPVYFSSLFRKLLGFSVSQYIQRIRVNRAEIMLSEGAYNVSEVASKCGFCDVYYFSRVFKRIKGIPPSAVKK